MTMHNLEAVFRERVAGGLRRKSITKPSKWALNYRVMGPPFPGPWQFKRHPWLLEMHDSESDFNIGQKAAQMGFTETMLNLVFYYIDIHGVDCLYVLPAKTPDASDFSAARFDPAIERSEHLEKLFSDVKNVGHKRAGNTNLYIRGSKSRSGLKSVPVGVLILDEKDEMNQDNIPLARERQSGYNIKKTWEISTPTIPDFGVNKTFKDSSKEEFFFKCPACSKLIHLVWPDSVEIVGENHTDSRIEDSYLKCYECQIKLPHELKHEWLSTGRFVVSNNNSSFRGFAVSQLYSSTIAPWQLVESYFLSKISPADEQEFFNSKLGIPHIVEGARVNDSDITQCTGDYLMVDNYQGNNLVTMGVDVGNLLHYTIEEWIIPPRGILDINIDSMPRTLNTGSVSDFEELDSLMLRFGVNSCVIDSQPERRKAYEFATRFYGMVRMCFYGRGIQGKQIHIHSDNELMVTVDRTSWLDLSLGRFRRKFILVPKNVGLEYKSHMKSLVRIYEKDADGNPVGKYVKSDSSNDHLAHARNYSEIALALGAGIGKTQDIESAV